MKPRKFSEIKRAKLIQDRLQVIRKIVKDKDVLDIGCVDHDSSLENDKHWLHKQIKNYSKNLTGIDWNKNEVKKLQSKGYNIIHANAEYFNLNKKFDVIVAGEFIEHLSNPGLFLDNVRKHLKKGGHFILTTPNSNSIFNFFSELIYGYVPINPDHMLWHSYGTLRQLLERHSFTVNKLYYIKSRSWRYKGIKKILILARNFAASIFISIRKDFAGSMLCVVKNQE